MEEDSFLLELELALEAVEVEVDPLFLDPVHPLLLIQISRLFREATCRMKRDKFPNQLRSPWSVCAW